MLSHLMYSVEHDAEPKPEPAESEPSHPRPGGRWGVIGGQVAGGRWQVEAPPGEPARLPLPPRLLPPTGPLALLPVQDLPGEE